MKKTLGVIVGRFQTAEITPGHEFLFSEVYKRHKNIVTFIGCKPPHFQPDEKNPLDFFSRKSMIQASKPDVSILSITDNRYDEEWSFELDKRIDEIRGSFDVILYGSRDSFISHYKGKFETCELESTIIYSATSVREEIIQKELEDKKFRCGYIYGLSEKLVCGLHNSFGLLYEKDEKGKLKILIGKRRGEKEYSLFGGIYNPAVDKSYSETMKRTMKEQLGNNVEISSVKFLFDYQLDHWAYKSSPDKIHGNFFLCENSWGFVRPNQDFELVEWVSLEDFDKKEMVSEFEMFKDKYIEALKEIKK